MHVVCASDRMQRCGKQYDDIAYRFFAPVNASGAGQRMICFYTARDDLASEQNGYVLCNPLNNEGNI